MQSCMSGNRVLAFALAGLSVLGATVVHAAVVHQYTFNDGSFADSVGGAPGTLVGSASVSGGQLVLPGGSARSNFGSLPSSTMTGLTSATFEGWFTMETKGYWSKVFMAGSDGYHYIDTTPFRGQTPAVASLSYNPTGAETHAQGTTELSTMKEYYFASVYDATAGAISLYIGSDGIVSLYATQPVPGLNLSNITFSQINLGAAVGYNDPDMTGKINEFRIHNTAMDSASITASFDAGPSVPEPVGLTMLCAGSCLLLRRSRTRKA